MIQLFCDMGSRIFILLFFLFTSLSNLQIFSQQIDSSSILTNIDIQIEATSAINKMYNFEFDDAEKEFRWLINEYRNHPLPVFLLGLSTWWKIYAGSDNFNHKVQENNYLDKIFLEYMDKSIELSKEIYNSGNIVDGAFFLSASYGFKGRLLSERKKWRSAAFAGRNAIKYLKEIRKDDIMIPEISFGNGLFNYYSVWISEKYPILKPVIKLFPKGDKLKGIEQLGIATNNSFYTRTEAQYFLMRIYSSEGKISKSLQLSNYLHNSYPDNSIFHKYYTQNLYRSGKIKLLLDESRILLKNFQVNKFGYNKDEARLAHFFIAEKEMSLLNFEDAIFNYKKCIEYSESIGKKKAGYSIYSNFYLGKIFSDLNKTKQAKLYFHEVIKNTRRKDEINIRSRKLLRKIK